MHIKIQPLSFDNAMANLTIWGHLHQPAEEPCQFFIYNKTLEKEEFVETSFIQFKSNDTCIIKNKGYSFYPKKTKDENGQEVLAIEDGKYFLFLVRNSSIVPSAIWPT